MPELNEMFPPDGSRPMPYLEFRQKLPADETTADSHPLTLEPPCLEPDLIELSSDVLLEVLTHFLLQKMRKFGSFEEFVAKYASAKATIQLLAAYFHQKYPTLRIKFPPGIHY
ncbi:hypothetical protein F5Y16DRAFT_403816 [Xylariaceae sp. FL0255]|nr:hypothetical protein F5Y16DRAFT_403816 [Xylariaceae sp. FL0255]